MQKKFNGKRKLRLRKESLRELTTEDLQEAQGGICPCVSDASNSCCGPNGDSC